MADKIVASIGDFLRVIAEESDDGQKLLWYRGQSKSEWPLLPGYYRVNHETSEGTLITRFKQSAALLTELTPKNDFDWLFVMQHYGVPTRLLDWSESPMVGLYFAVEEFSSYPDEDAALWCLSPSLLNRKANISDKDEPYYIPSFDEEVIKGYLPISVRQDTRLQLIPVAAIATRNNARIQAQMGTFTIHHSEKVPIEDVGDGGHVDKIIIPSECRSKILKELRILGINRFSLFPELSSVGRILSESLNGVR